jgi:hypothetical protein
VLRHAQAHREAVGRRGLEAPRDLVGHDRILAQSAQE